MQELAAYSYKIPHPSSMKVPICFDVDGLIADHRGGKPYCERVPYPWVVKRLTALKQAGYYIRLQTARYMKRCDGEQERAHEAGYYELKVWTDKYGIPYDELYLGKCSAMMYVDDRGFRLRSDDGEEGWNRLFEELSVSYESQ